MPIISWLKVRNELERLSIALSDSRVYYTMLSNKLEDQQRQIAELVLENRSMKDQIEKLRTVVASDLPRETPRKARSWREVQQFMGDPLDVTT